MAELKHGPYSAFRQSAGLWVHRIGILIIAPFVWALATVAYLIAAPFFAADTLWTVGIKKHWNDQ